MKINSIEIMDLYVELIFILNSTGFTNGAHDENQFHRDHGLVRDTFGDMSVVMQDGTYIFFASEQILHFWLP